MFVLKKQVSLIKRWICMLLGKSATAVKQGAGSVYSKKEIRGYYNDMTGKVRNTSLLDERGIPVSLLDNGEKVYFPIVIFQYGLGCYDLWIKNHDMNMRNKTIQLADWAIQTQNADGSWDNFSVLNSKKYNVSSMCQGEGASLLLRASQIQFQKKYEDAGIKAIDFMLKDVKDGGTAIYDGEKLYLEEYPQSPRRSVLNGWIYSLFGLYDAMLLYPDKYKVVWKKCIDALHTDIVDYDAGFWSYYDVNKKIASPGYHDVHIHLLNVLSDLTDDLVYKEMARRFVKYQNNKAYCLWAFIVKVFQKMKEPADCSIIIQ